MDGRTQNGVFKVCLFNRIKYKESNFVITCVGGEGGEVLGHAGGISLVVIDKPLLGRACVGHGLLGSETDMAKYYFDMSKGQI